MAKKVLGYPAWNIQGGALASGETNSNYVQGTFVGYSSTGIKRADYRAAQGPVVALGVLREDVERKDPRNNVVTTDKQVSWVSLGRVSGFTGLTKGAYYYLGQAGALHTVDSTAPAALAGDIDQLVAVAVNATTISLLISGVVKHA